MNEASQRRRRRGRAWSAAVIDAIDDLRTTRRLSAEAISRELERMQSDGKLPMDDDLPTARSVLNVLEDLDPRNKTGAWHLRTARPGDDLLLLTEVLAAVLRETKGGALTLAEADWCQKLYRAGCDIDRYHLWRLARRFVALQEDESASALDAFVAFKPWSGREAFADYERVIEEGKAQLPPAFLMDYARALAGEAAVRAVKSWARQPEGEPLPGAQP